MNKKEIPDKSPDQTEQEDLLLFQKAMQDVTPIKQTKAVNFYDRQKIKQETQQKLRKVRQKNRIKERTKLHQKELDTSQPIGAFERILHHEKGIRLQDMARLKNSDFQLSAQLDLHGKTQQEAEEAIQNFIQDALAHRMKYVRIIHGKGYNSESDFPILKNLCYQQLKRLSSVVAFCSAPEKNGGVGALNIQLKIS